MTAPNPLAMKQAKAEQRKALAAAGYKGHLDAYYLKMMRARLTLPGKGAAISKRAEEIMLAGKPPQPLDVPVSSSGKLNDPVEWVDDVDEPCEEEASGKTDFVKSGFNRDLNLLLSGPRRTIEEANAYDHQAAKEIETNQNAAIRALCAEPESLRVLRDWYHGLSKEMMLNENLCVYRVEDRGLVANGLGWYRREEIWPKLEDIAQRCDGLLAQKDGYSVPDDLVQDMATFAPRQKYLVALSARLSAFSECAAGLLKPERAKKLESSAQAALSAMFKVRSRRSDVVKGYARLIFKLTLRERWLRVPVVTLFNDVAGQVLGRMDKWDISRGTFVSFLGNYVSLIAKKVAADYYGISQVGMRHRIKIQRAEKEFMHLHKCEPSEKQLAKHMGIKVATLRRRRSLDPEISQPEELGPFIGTHAPALARSTDPAVVLENKESRKVGLAFIRSTMNGASDCKLTPNELWVLTKRYIEDPPEGKKWTTLQDVADERGVSRERIRQIEASALKKMHKMLEGFSLV